MEQLEAILRYIGEIALPVAVAYWIGQQRGEAKILARWTAEREKERKP